MLPTTIPIFPLPGVLLLPRAQLPLHIFEPRYRAMTEDALDGDGLIAMIQPLADDSADPGRPSIFPVGCVGRIDEADKVEDGRFNIRLLGVTRFRVVEELPLVKGYRRVVASYDEFRDDVVTGRPTEIDRKALFAALDAYLKSRGFGADWDTMRETEDEALVSALAMLCPFAPSEKQALLECKDTDDRARVLTALCEMAAASAAAAGAASNDNDPKPLH